MKANRQAVVALVGRVGIAATEIVYRHGEVNVKAAMVGSEEFKDQVKKMAAAFGKRPVAVHNEANGISWAVLRISRSRYITMRRAPMRRRVEVEFYDYVASREANGI